ncbi:MAG: glycosyltransferase family 4 protein [Planctomycetes bacterium]|nr:glycosyltransferase family 4 protein [Planctomycetota bacterium]
MREILCEFARRESDLELFAVAPDRAPSIALPAEMHTKIHQAAIPTRGRRWRGKPAELFIKENSIDVFWSTVSAFPRGAECPTVVTVHEAPWEVPGTRGDEGTGWNHRLLATLDAWFSTRVVCPSQSTANDFLASNLRKSFKSKVVVVPWGVSSIFQSELPKGATTRIDNYKFSNEYPFFLMVAAPRKIKNFDLAIRALKIVRDRGNVDARLFIAGPNGVELHRALGYADGLGLRTHVTAMNFVPEAELAELYRRARATLVLSRSEGFGFPVLESMACGTPVIHSGMGSLAEVAGDAGVRVNIDDEEEVARQMIQVHNDNNYRSSLIEKGKLRAAGYKWSSTADALARIFSELGGAVAAAGASGHH